MVKIRSRNNKKKLSKKKKAKSAQYIPNTPVSRENSSQGIEMFNIIMVRCLVRDKGCIDVNSAINELFTGIGGNGKFSIIGLPSSIILPESANIIITSQIFERKFDDNFRNVTKYIELLRSSSNQPKITWICCPSIIFNYSNRLFINSNNTCVNGFFNLTTWASTGCIINKGEESVFNKLNHCEKYLEIKKCFTEVNKKTEELYTKHFSFTEKANKFKTKIEDMITDISNEQYSLDTLRPDTNFQRYNELFSNFYPWDIDGIEIGGGLKMDKTELTKLINLILEKRKYLNEYYEKLLIQTEDLQIPNYLIDLLINNYKYLENKLMEFIKHNKNSNDYDDTIEECKALYLLSKYIMECNCNSSIKDLKEEDIINIIKKIIIVLKNPIKIYEYNKLDSDNYYKLIKKTDISLDVSKEQRDVLIEDSIKRKYTFKLYTQRTMPVTIIEHSNSQI